MSSIVSAGAVTINTRDSPFYAEREAADEVGAGVNWGETPSGVVSNFGTGSSTEACSGREDEGKKKKKKALVI